MPTSNDCDETKEGRFRLDFTTTDALAWATVRVGLDKDGYGPFASFDPSTAWAGQTAVSKYVCLTRAEEGKDTDNLPKVNVFYLFLEDADGVACVDEYKCNVSNAAQEAVSWNVVEINPISGNKLSYSTDAGAVNKKTVISDQSQRSRELPKCAYSPSHHH